MAHHHARHRKGPVRHGVLRVGWHGRSTDRGWPLDDELSEREAIRPGYGLLNLSLRFSLTDELSLGGTLRNAMDKSYRLGTRPDDPLGPARTLVVSLAWAR